MMKSARKNLLRMLLKKSFQRKLVVLSQTNLDGHFSNVIKTPAAKLVDVHSVDLSRPDADALPVWAYEDHGFLKDTNHSIPPDSPPGSRQRLSGSSPSCITRRTRRGPPIHSGTEAKTIGRNGDIGWVEYLLFSTNPDIVSASGPSAPLRNRPIFPSAVEAYMAEVKTVTYRVLDLISDNLGIEPRDGLSLLLRDEKSDSCFRVNHYPACPEPLQDLINGRNQFGFGKHTDPQIISVPRSNNTPGFQICLQDSSGVSVPPDDTSLFFRSWESMKLGKMRTLKSK